MSTVNTVYTVYNGVATYGKISTYINFFLLEEHVLY